MRIGDYVNHRCVIWYSGMHDAQSEKAEPQAKKIEKSKDLANLSIMQELEDLKN